MKYTFTMSRNEICVLVPLLIDKLRKKAFQALRTKTYASIMLDDEDVYAHLVIDHKEVHATIGMADINGYVCIMLHSICYDSDKKNYTYHDDTLVCSEHLHDLTKLVAEVAVLQKMKKCGGA